MAALASGTRFAGRYDIEGVLGEGGMGTVYAARHAFTARPVALKVLHDFASSTSTARERFLREAQAPAAAGHPGIVGVLDAGDEGGTLYLAMERLVGRDLGAAMAAGEMDPERLLRMAVELLDALSAAHAVGLVHRDIKPENVFLLSRPENGTSVRLLDFGITGIIDPAPATTRLTQAGVIMGTPAYMSPEQARGERVDGRADLWAVGAILFDGLTGRPPFDTTNFHLLITQILTETPPPIRSVRPDLPPSIATAIDGALRPRREERWPDAASMRDALAAALGMAPVARDHARPASAPFVMSRPDPRAAHPRSAPAHYAVPSPSHGSPGRSSPAAPLVVGALAAVALLVLLAGGGGAALYVLKRRAPPPPAPAPVVATTEVPLPSSVPEPPDPVEGPVPPSALTPEAVPPEAVAPETVPAEIVPSETAPPDPVEPAGPSREERAAERRRCASRCRSEQGRCGTSPQLAFRCVESFARCQSACMR